MYFSVLARAIVKVPSSFKELTKAKLPLVLDYGIVANHLNDIAKDHPDIVAQIDRTPKHLGAFIVFF